MRQASGLLLQMHAGRRPAPPTPLSILAVVLCPSVALAAAHSAGTQAAASSAQAASGTIGSLLSLLLLIAGTGVWLWVGGLVRRRGWGVLSSGRLDALDDHHAANAPPGPFVPGAALVLAGLAAWLVQPIGAVMARAVADAASPLPPGTTEPDLRAGVIAQAGAHTAAAFMIALIAFLLPGTWRAIGASLRGTHASTGPTPRPAHPPAKIAWNTVRLAFIWTVMVGPAVYLVGSLSLWAARAAAAWLGQPIPKDVAHKTLTSLASPAEAASDTLWWWATVVGVTVGAPIIEEFIYRGLIQTGLLRLTRSGTVAIIGTSVPFALAHVGAVQSHALLTLFVLSLGFGLALEKTGKLWVCVLMHAAFNGANVALAMVR